MDHKVAAEILIKILERYSLTEEEKEAVKTAIGILAWTQLSKSRLNSRKANRDKLE